MDAHRHVDGMPFHAAPRQASASQPKKAASNIPPLKGSSMTVCPPPSRGKLTGFSGDERTGGAGAVV